MQKDETVRTIKRYQRSSSERPLGENEMPRSCPRSRLTAWLNVRRASVRMIEGPNLLMMPRREAAPVGAKSEAPG
jgi:hypothetical protein